MVQKHIFNPFLRFPIFDYRTPSLELTIFKKGMKSFETVIFEIRSAK